MKIAVAALLGVASAVSIQAEEAGFVDDFLMSEFYQQYVATQQGVTAPNGTGSSGSTTNSSSSSTGK